MRANCTWAGCLNDATHKQTSLDGSEWANLCGVHDHELTQAVRTGEAPSISRAWVLAREFEPQTRTLADMIQRVMAGEQLLTAAIARIQDDGEDTVRRIG
jgi:hypothetical protein